MFKAVSKGDQLVSVGEGKFCCGGESSSGDSFSCTLHVHMH